MGGVIQRPGLKRSREYRVLFGVCGGFAEWLGWRPWAVRILFLVVSAVSVAFPGILVYVLMMFLMPLRGKDGR